MKACAIVRAGGAEVFQMREMPTSTPAPNQILVRVSACAINPVDCKIRKGLVDIPYQYPLILGYDVSGVVETVGEGATNFKPGDSVFYCGPINLPGGYAEYHIVDQRLVMPKPFNLSHVEAASIPLVGLTAWEALFERGAITIGETILIQGGGGGVGSMAIQLAKWAGLTIFATDKTENGAFVRELGADYFIDYLKDDFLGKVKDLTKGRGVDVVFDTVGGETLARSFEAVRRDGRVVSIVEERKPMNLIPLFLRNATFHYEFMALAMTYGEFDHKRTVLSYLSTLIERNFICPVVKRTYPLAQAAEAHDCLENNRVPGKIVLEIRT